MKGTEKFWSSGGADALLQLAADYLSDTQPLTTFWRERTSPSHRPTALPDRRINGAKYYHNSPSHWPTALPDRRVNGAKYNLHPHNESAECAVRYRPNLLLGPLDDVSLPTAAKEGDVVNSQPTTTDLSYSFL